LLISVFDDTLIIMAHLLVGKSASEGLRGVQGSSKLLTDKLASLEHEMSKMKRTISQQCNQTASLEDDVRNIQKTIATITKLGSDHHDVIIELDLFTEKLQNEVKELKALCERLIGSQEMTDRGPTSCQNCGTQATGSVPDVKSEAVQNAPGRRDNNLAVSS